MFLMALETQADNWPDGSERDDWFLKAGKVGVALLGRQ
jgi:hypothetical protein